MPATNRKLRTPEYSRHKDRRLAIVTIDGQDHYLARYGDEPSPIRRGNSGRRTPGGET